MSKQKYISEELQGLIEEAVANYFSISHDEVLVMNVINEDKIVLCSVDLGCINGVETGQLYSVQTTDNNKVAFKDNKPVMFKGF